MADGRTHYLISTRIGNDRFSVHSAGADSVRVGEFFRDGDIWRVGSPYATFEELGCRFDWSGDAYKLLWRISLREGFSVERDSR